MRKVSFLTLFILFMLNSIFAASPKNTLMKADRLIKQKKYLSAYKLLSKYDKDNNISAIQITKVDLTLKYFAKSKIHRSFAFVDLQHNENLDDYREKEWKFDLFEFNIDEILTKCIKKEPKNGELYRALGDFYFAVQRRYGNRWELNLKTLLNLSEKNYLKALELKSRKYKELDKLGVIMVVKKNFEKAMDYFERSIEENNKYGKSYYNMAFAYYKLKQYKSALPYAKKAYNLFKEKKYKFDSAYLVAGLYVLLADNKNAIKYYQSAYRIKVDYESLKSILVLYLKEHDLHNANKYAIKIFNFDKTNLKNSQDILFIYGDMGYKNELLVLFNEIEKKFKNDNLILGNICFNRAFFYSYFMNDYKLKKENLIKSREYYKKVLPSEHKVFPIIEKELKNNKK